MPTRTLDTDPFAPRRPLSRDELQAYAEGRLDPGRRRAVEEHIEADALVRDAVDGLCMPGAAAGLKELDALRPRAGGAVARWWWAGATAVIALLAIWHYWPVPMEEKAIAGSASDRAIREAAPMEPMRAEEIAAASEQPESLRIGHEPLALHVNPAALQRLAEPARRLEREGSIEPMAPREVVIERGAEAAEPLVVRKAKASRQLVFLHDLKLIHPKELYTADPVLALSDAGVAARFADAGSARAADKPVMMTYLGFMDDALGRFVQNDHKGCLDDLRFVLSQYPDDANALFYAGLCSYNLGMHPRARVLLHRAAVHPVDVFDEEAAWYHALTLEKLGERDAAREAFARIAAQGGFYAEDASTRLGRF
ncbi:MAG: hypothetical protein IPF41_01400 [Flavobacteriales bacterium]|jgi:tetratricopeptide (TPR) repeat protein|nr:hypothetical protein [Flavobacteriales bacterium]